MVKPENAYAGFALLDDCEADVGQRRSRLYTGYLRTLTCGEAGELPPLFEEMQAELAQGRHAIGLFAYEFGAGMHGVAARGERSASVLIFADCRHMSAEEVDDWLRTYEDLEQFAAGNAVRRPSGVAAVRAGVPRSEFADKFARIGAYLESGDIYQLNYTFPVHFDAFGSPVGLYRRLRERQPVPYGTLIALPGGGAVLSLSPELFLRHEKGVLTAQPMKGTAIAGEGGDERERAEKLAADEKNRAENLMIVDLLRNDLGRVARTGSVEVPALFEVRRHGEVLQMTSTVRAWRRGDASLADIFLALFPCGSVTGAPKRRAMQIIAELESEARGLYTGAIGWFEPAEGDQAVGDFCLSVPIRTLVLEAERHGVRGGVMRVGSGIVYDSRAEAEYAECLLKARFLTGLAPSFELLETLHATRTGCRYLDLHLGRLRASALYFGFVFEEEAIRRVLAAASAALPANEAWRIRLALGQDGHCVLQSAPLTSLPSEVKVVVSPHCTRADDVFLRHKTTVREAYDQAWRKAEERGAFDMLFFNERGELTEGARSNVLLKLDGRWYTPALSSGLLPGVMRQVLLADARMAVCEKVLMEDDLRDAEEIILCNALRGTVKASLIED